MKIFLTGGSGFIGRNLIPLLKDHEVMCLSHSNQIMGDRTNLYTISGSLNEPESYFEELSKFKPDCCIHLAWFGLPDYSLENNIKNLLYGVDLVKNLSKVGCKKIFSVGSCWEYGDAIGALKETDSAINLGMFGAFKSSLQVITQSLCNNASIDLIWGRVFFVYGPGQRKTSLIPSCYESLKDGKPLNIKNPLAINDFVYIRDVVENIHFMIETRVNPGIYNIGSGKSYSVWEVVNNVANVLGVDSPYKDISNQMSGSWADITKCIESGWTPRFTLKEGISETIKDLQGYS